MDKKDEAMNTTKIKVDTGVNLLLIVKDPSREIMNNKDKEVEAAQQKKIYILYHGSIRTIMKDVCTDFDARRNLKVSSRTTKEAKEVLTWYRNGWPIRGTAARRRR